MNDLRGRTTDHTQLLRRELRAARRTSPAGSPVDGILPTLGISTLGLSTVIATPFMSNGNLLEYLRAERWADRLGLVHWALADAEHPLIGISLCAS